MRTLCFKLRVVFAFYTVHPVDRRLLLLQANTNDRDTKRKKTYPTESGMHTDKTLAETTKVLF